MLQSCIGKPPRPEGGRTLLAKVPKPCPLRDWSDWAVPIEVLTVSFSLASSLQPVRFVQMGKVMSGGWHQQQSRYVAFTPIIDDATRRFNHSPKASG